MSDVRLLPSRIVIPSAALDLCHSRSSGRYWENVNGKPDTQKTFGHRHYLYSAALRSSDSVLIFQIIHFLTYDVFLRSG